MPAPNRLSDLENCAIGAICGTADTTLLQSTNYWKNAQQQRLPFTMNPAVLCAPSPAADPTACGVARAPGSLR